MSQSARNVVFIVVDTARADAFEPYGATEGSTPTFRELAAEGWAAERAIASSSWTLPSHVGMLVGASHRDVGLHKGAQENPLAAQPVMTENRDRYLPQILQQNGYRTVGASANLWVQPESGFGHGFDEFHPLWDWQAARLPRRLRPAVEKCAVALGRHNFGMREATRIADQWIDDSARTRQPSFLFLNIMECHSPYLAPSPFNGLSPRGRLGAWKDAKTYLSMEATWLANLGQALPPADCLARMRHQYVQAARYVDWWLGKFVERLRRQGLYDDTLLIVTSDHGENFGEQSRLGHSFSVDDRLIHVPLIVVNANAPAPSPVFSLTGLPALIGNELELEHPWQPARSNDIAVSRIEGIRSADDHDVLRFLSNAGLASAAPLMSRDLICATNGRHKVIRADGADVVFDLQRDPLEANPIPWAAVGGRGDADLERLREEISQAERAASSDLRPTSEAQVDVDSDTAKRLAEKMKLLGYA